MNRIGVKGKVGTYGRSIGGIAASHLVSKFPDHIEVFVGDRTMGSFENLAS
jgi:pimeloyl-ACP methyl ester carboxylesterase